MRSNLIFVCALAAIFVLNHPVKAFYYVEVTSGPGVNVMNVELWADGDQLGDEISNLTAVVEFSNFTGNIDGTDVSFQSYNGLSGFFPFSVQAGDDFTSPVKAAVFNFATPVKIPSTANSAANAIPVIEIVYSSTGTGTFDALVQPPIGTGGTLVEGSVALTRTGMTPATLSAIPEPSSFILVGLMAGLGYGCVWLRRRRADNAE